MYSQTIYRWISEFRCRGINKRQEVIQNQFFGNDVEQIGEEAVEASQSAPLSSQSLIDLRQLKERIQFNREPSLGTDVKVAAMKAASWLQRNVLVNGMPPNARRMLKDAESVLASRRKRDRTPFIHPVVIRLANDRRISAVTRDISPLGIGLLHGGDIAPQIVEIEARLADDSAIQLSVELLWCMNYGAGWHFSGGIFRCTEN